VNKEKVWSAIGTLSYYSLFGLLVWKTFDTFGWFLGTGSLLSVLIFLAGLHTTPKEPSHERSEE
jgi:hypothetical protein